MAASGTKIVIEINGNIQTSGISGESENINKEKKENSQIKKIESSFTGELLDYGKNTVLKAVDLTVNRNLSLTENYIGQQTLSNVKNILSKSEGLIRGIKLGAAGGPAGIALAVASWGTSQYFDFLNKKSNYYQALNATNAQTEFSQTRAGLYNDGRGTLN